MNDHGHDCDWDSDYVHGRGTQVSAELTAHDCGHGHESANVNDRPAESVEC